MTNENVLWSLVVFREAPKRGRLDTKLQRIAFQHRAWTGIPREEQELGK